MLQIAQNAWTFSLYLTLSRYRRLNLTFIYPTSANSSQSFYTDMTQKTSFIINHAEKIFALNIAG